MRTSSIAILLCSVLATGVSAQQASSTSDKIHPQMTRLIAERGPAKGWVFFKDKGVEGPQAMQAELWRASQNLTPRSLERRARRRTNPGLVDIKDVRVNAGYLTEILATGVEFSVESRWLNAVSVTGDAAQFESIAALPFVDRVEPVRRGVLVDDWDAEQLEQVPSAKRSLRRAGVQAAGAPPAFYGLAGPQLEQVNLISVHDRGYTGDGVVIGILDTGFHRGHEAFNEPGHVVNVLAEYDFVDDDGNTGIESGDPGSQHTHGTYILGVIGAYLPNELVGGAYDASFILAKTEDTTDEYQQEEDFYVAGLEFIEANGGDLATSSLGYINWYTQDDLDGLTATTTTAVNIATSNGLHCLTAAGNSGHDTDPSTSALIAPADAFEVITCGAVDEFGAAASFTSDGPSADGRTKPELVARGVATWTVCSQTDVDCTTPVNGTSLSTPVLAAMVGCLVEAHPNWSVAKLRRRLFATGDFFEAHGSFDAEYVFGFGIPDADRAGFLPIEERRGTPTNTTTISR